MASAFRFPDRRSFAFSFSSFSSLASDSLSLRAASSFLLSSSDNDCGTDDDEDDDDDDDDEEEDDDDDEEEEVVAPRVALPLFVAAFPSPASPPSRFRPHSINSARFAHPDSSTAIASALRLADRRSLALGWSASRVARASSSFAAAAAVLLAAPSSPSSQPSPTTTTPSFSASSLSSSSSSSSSAAAPSFFGGDGSGGTYVSPLAAARVALRRILAADLPMVWRI